MKSAAYYATVTGVALLFLLGIAGALILATR